MAEDKKKAAKPKTLHVDTLHIHAKEIVLHQDGQGQAPDPRAFPRDFWGFPIRQVQNEANENDNKGEENQNRDGNPQGPPPGWI